MAALMKILKRVNQAVCNKCANESMIGPYVAWGGSDILVFADSTNASRTS